jgi:DNA-binding transcriptional MerR regulator
MFPFVCKLQKQVEVVTWVCYYDGMERVFYTTEVARITGFSLRQLDYWAREGIIVPSFKQAAGSGSRRLYTLDDLLRLNFVRQLKKYHWSTQKIHKAITTLQDVMNDPNPLKSAILIHGKGTILALSKTQAGEKILIDALSTSGQLVMNFVLEALIEETQRVTSAITTVQSAPSSRRNTEEVRTGGSKQCH